MHPISLTKLQHSGETLRTTPDGVAIEGPQHKDNEMTWRFLVMLLGTALAVGCHGNSASSSGTPVQTGRLRFMLPAGWRQVPPNSSMRVAQAVIPGAAGEGELAVFFFGAGQGGS